MGWDGLIGFSRGIAGCQTSTDTINVIAQCIDLVPALKISRGLIADTAAEKRGLYRTDKHHYHNDLN